MSLKLNKTPAGFDGGLVKPAGPHHHVPASLNTEILQMPSKLNLSINRTSRKAAKNPSNSITCEYRPADKLLPLLRKVKRTGPGRWIACCPAHDDRTPSLAIRELEDGRLLLHDFAGCSAAEVVAAVGLELKDLFPPQPDPITPGKPARPSSFYASDVLRLIHHEVLIVLAAAYASMKQELGDDDVTRLELAIDRLTDALRLAGVKEK